MTVLRPKNKNNNYINDYSSKSTERLKPYLAKVLKVTTVL